MSITGFLINEEMADLDPDILLTPGTGESWWFEELWVAGANDNAGLAAFTLEYVSDSSVVSNYVLNDAGVNSSTAHKHFISRYQRTANTRYILRCLPDFCVPDGCRIRMTEAVDAFGSDSVIIHGIGAVIDSTDEVSHAELWQNLDPDTIIQPATGQMIRWEIMFIGCSGNAAGLNLTLRRQTTFEVVYDFGPSKFVADPTNGNDYETWKTVDGVTAIPSDVAIPPFISAGYELLLVEALGIGHDAAILFVGREYSAL